MKGFIHLCALSFAILVGYVAVRAQAPTPSSPAPLTHAEQQDLTILSLKAQLASAAQQVSALKADIGACHAQLGPAQFEQNRQALTGEQSALKAQIEKARGDLWSWDPATGTFSVKPADLAKKKE